MAFLATLAITLSGDQLYDGFEAHRVVLKDGAVTLDAQTWRKGLPGRITTDVIDLDGDEPVSAPRNITSIKIVADADVTPPAAVQISARTGTTFFQTDTTWTDWIPVGDRALPARARYVQVRITLTSEDKAALPAVRGLRIEYQRTSAAAFAGKVEVVESAIEKIVRSPIQFAYERQDQADLAWMRKTFKLDEVVAGKKTEMEKLAALCEWVASRKNDRSSGWRAPYRHYPWDIRKMLKDADGGTIYGHCGSYCAVFITAAQSLGWQGRHFANSGYKRRSHEVPEIWVNELKKWVYFDPSLDAYYTDAKTGEPLSILEMHRIFLQHMYPNGIVQGTLSEERQKVNNKAINWSIFPARYVSDLWSYGEKKQEPDFWKWGQGLMTCGRLQMTPRGNFHSQPKPYFTRFGHGPGSEPTFPYWVDGQTPGSARLRQPSRREREWYWTLNQASMRLVRVSEDEIEVELGTSQPFFKRFVAAVDGTAPVAVTSPYTWKLKPGRNALQVNCEDDFGAPGLPSKVVVAYRK